MLFGSRNYGPEVDMWSFGCIMGELINGTPAFPGTNEIDQLARIAEVVGSPSKENWKLIEEMPD